ncbi:MAG: ATP-binding cassette domain-containing protein [Planctomycetes bacterium]|nr:ATP-binding cassette domain-containing protein [Planctomycetota bacterium]
MSQGSLDTRETVPLRGVRLIRPFGGWLALVVVLLCLLTITDMALPWFLKLLVDDVFVPAASGGGNWSLLWLILPGIGVIYVSRNTLFFLSRMRALRISEDLCFELRQRIFEHLQQLSMRFYRSHQPGRLSARLMDDTFRIQLFIQDKLPTLIRYLLEFQVLLIIVYAVNWRLALASTIVLPLHLLVYRRYRRSIRSSHSEAQQQLEVAHGSVVEQFLGIEVVKGFTAEERESRSFREAIDASRRSKIRSQRFHFSQKVAADLVVGVGTVLLLGYGAWEVAQARMTGGSFLMFFWYVKMLYPAALEVISGAGHLSRASASADRIFEMLDEPMTEKASKGEDVDPESVAGAIAFEGVSFAYEPGGAPALTGIDLEIRPGEHIAVTGPSGSGKSTLLSLLPRFNEADTGRVLIDGRPVDDLNVRALRRLFGIVFQDLFLFDASIYENLRYARPKATPDELIEACRITGAHEFIDRLPHGYDTRIGASGVELSRGEKQRITIARALVRNPRILILDEATASLDAVSGREIMRTVLERAQDRTVILVTHDNELLDLVDRVVALEQGRITFEGTPADMDHPLISNSPGSPPATHLRRAAEEAERDAVVTRDDSNGSRHDAPAIVEETERGSRTKPRTGPAATLLLLTLLVAGSCRTERTSSSLGFDEPRVGPGTLIIEEAEPVRLLEMAEALDAIALDPSGIRPGGDAHPTLEAALAARDAKRATVDEVVEILTSDQVPADAQALRTMPRLNDTELRELISGLKLRLGAEHGYADATDLLDGGMPDPPPGMKDAGVIARVVDGQTTAIRFAYREFASQPPHLWYAAVSIGPDETITASPDLALIEPAVAVLLGSLEEMRGSITAAELDAKMIQLGYADATHAVSVLRSLGINAIDEAGKVPEAIDFAKLPFVIKMPDPEAGEIALVGGNQAIGGGSTGLSLAPSVATAINGRNLMSPMTQLLVLYHPAHPEQFSRVESLVDEYIDRPARQIFVEGMVLQISESGLKDLGIEWEMNSGPIRWGAGTLEADGLEDTLDFQMDDLDFWRVFTRNFEYMFTVKLRTLVRDGKAQILSRPSVLTVNNRQSTIRVGTDIPIATSQEIGVNSSKVSFQFKYLPTGILLNIRPRINEDGSEVSMLVDTIVSQTVTGEELEVRDSEGNLLASAPTVASRRVQTYARIRNNTPFIIGGLVSNIETTEMDKVPLLGDLPLIGGLFRAERTVTEKLEVIIVLTPYVLPEGRLAGRTTPKGEDIFDSFGNRLFRDSYRIRARDVFDLGFLIENHRLNVYRDLAQEAIEGNFELGEIEPFRSFADGALPGEDVLVTRMIYEVAKRLEVGMDIPLVKMLLFAEENVGGFEVADIESALAQAVDSKNYKDFFRRRPDQALAISFVSDPRTMEPGTIARRQIPKIKVVDCPRSMERETWSDLLWTLNQPDEYGQPRSTVLIQNDKDLIRLRRAVALRRIVLLNGGPEHLTLEQFSAGKVLLVPEIKPEQGHIIDPEVARYFFWTEHYYGAALQKIENRLTELDLALRRPEVRALLGEAAEQLPEE